MLMTQNLASDRVTGFQFATDSCFGVYNSDNLTTREKTGYVPYFLDN